MVWIAKTIEKPMFFCKVFWTLWVLGRGGWGILGTVSGDVGSKRVIFRGSWGYVVTFWCRPVPETLPGCTLAGSWVAGWGAWGPRGSPGREGTLRDAFPVGWGG